MTRDEGLKIAELAQDVIAFAEERAHEPVLLAALVQLVVEEADGAVRVVSKSWPERE